MIAAITFHRGNRGAAERLCTRIKELGGVSRHKCLLCVDESGIAERCAEILAGVFSSVEIFVAHENPSGWPARENALIFNTAQRIYYREKQPWLRVEPDSVPTAPEWLDRIESEYFAKGRPVMAGTSSRANRLCGACVFPANLPDYSIKVMQPDGEPWTAAAWAEISPVCSFTALMSENDADMPLLHVRRAGGVVGAIDRRCIVQLGRMGDILNILPLVRHISLTEGKPVLMVHKDYADIVADLDYCDAEIWENGAWSDLSMAVDDAQAKYKHVTVSQIHGDRWQTERKSASFCIESWRQAGHDREFGRHPLVLSRNNLREDVLGSQFATSTVLRSIVLINAVGTSSPLANPKRIFDLFPAESWDVIDLSTIRASRFQDLLGLYQFADLLVTIDTATLHLAEASDIPTIALIADTPRSWHGATPKGNTVLTIRYGEFESRLNEFLGAIEHNRRGIVHPAIHHVYQDFAGSEDAQRRNALAAETWAHEYAIGGYVRHPVRHTLRDSRCIGDTRELLFIKDLIDRAAADAEQYDWIMLTNTDTCVRRGLTHEIHRLAGEAYFSHRWDFPRLERPLTINEIPTGQWYPGSDLFVFRASWWEQHRDEMPDMILGAEAWDKILRQLIKDTGGGEIHVCCYHERHASKWEAADARISDVSNRWSRCLAKDFLRKRGHPLDELAQFHDVRPEYQPISLQGGQVAKLPGSYPGVESSILSPATPRRKRRARRTGKRTNQKKRTYTPEQIEKLRANMAKARAARKCTLSA